LAAKQCEIDRVCGFEIVSFAGIDLVAVLAFRDTDVITFGSDDRITPVPGRGIERFLLILWDVEWTRLKPAVFGKAESLIRHRHDANDGRIQCGGDCGQAVVIGNTRPSQHYGHKDEGWHCNEKQVLRCDAPNSWHEKGNLKKEIHQHYKKVVD